CDSSAAAARDPRGAAHDPRSRRMRSSRALLPPASRPASAAARGPVRSPRPSSSLQFRGASFQPQMNADERRLKKQKELNHEWPRMDTNEEENVFLLFV